MKLRIFVAEFEASLVYRVSSKDSQGSTEKPCLKKKQQQQQQNLCSCGKSQAGIAGCASSGLDKDPVFPNKVSTSFKAFPDCKRGAVSQGEEVQCRVVFGDLK